MTQKTRARSRAQESQRKLVERGEKLPGVAEAIAVYGSLPHTVTATPAPDTVRICSAAGGNINSHTFC